MSAAPTTCSRNPRDSLIMSIIPLKISQDGCSMRSCSYVDHLIFRQFCYHLMSFLWDTILPFQCKYCYRISTRKKIGICCICCVLGIVLSALYASSYALVTVALSMVTIPIIRWGKGSSGTLHVCPGSHSRGTLHIYTVGGTTIWTCLMSPLPSMLLICYFLINIRIDYQKIAWKWWEELWTTDRVQTPCLGFASSCSWNSIKSFDIQVSAFLLVN